MASDENAALPRVGRTPCIYKSGLDWPVRKGPQAQGLEREARPVHGHAIEPNWRSIGERIYQRLDSRSLTWTSINPLAYANAGEANPFCFLTIYIGVKPHSLLYDDAVAAAAVVKEILAEAGFPSIEVAFVESIVTRSVAAGPKLLSFNPLLDDVPDLRKPFTPTLGLSIAPLKYPHFEGTGAFYFRLSKLSKDDDRTAILTCAHVARPPPARRNTGMMRTNRSQPREDIVALGNIGYSNAVKGMMGTIRDLLHSIDAWNDVLRRLGDHVEGEHVNLVAGAKKKIQLLNALHDEVTKRCTIPDLRVIGFVLHSEKIEVSVDPHGYTSDWALIELFKEKIDWASFKGNKVYIGGNLSVPDFRNTMFPHPADQANYKYPEDGLLQAYGVVRDQEIRNPPHLDVNGEKCLLVVKNGLATGTTVGRVNGPESFTRTYDEYGIKQTSFEIAVLAYGRAHGKFSDDGDSGSIILFRDGRIVGLLTGGGGPTDETDITYLTPYWWVEEKIKAKYPGCFLYQVVE
ncbi:hypothetical protein NEOLEDRAFT_1154829 [Neolentinus lepideus HHB14362 ss-1]|uniref:Uncharacterized protein n=1 Tax=Neolentinus lepideus HHB14362 ss-1 TaxID=1314782 RepID=A0A165UA10_9AGAM|nr:hypothetical protein NEOLEDRAFT_1154829 [Neolentinus lepideus HHB14362 ss-1]